MQIVKSWVKQLTRQRGYTDQMVEDANAVIFTFGSYRLGVSLLVLPFLTRSSASIL
jgi:poly(A) polymerase Pap1